MNSEWFNQNLMLIVFALCVLSVLSLIIAMYALSKYNKLKRRYEFFMGANRKRPDHNMEGMLKDYINTVRIVESDVDKIQSDLERITKELSKCVQKVGVVRYNPYDEMGGNLCYAVALLDKDNNGIVFNGLYSRTGSFTYAKPIEAGTSTYVLSAEEIEALERAEKSTFDENSDDND